MRRRSRRTRQREADDLQSVQRFHGTLSDGTQSMPVRFNARIRDDGEVEVDLHAFRITRATWFVRDHWHKGGSTVPEFSLSGVTQDGLRFDTDSLSFNALGERWSGVHNRHWSKPRGEVAKGLYVRKLEALAERTFLKLHLRGFECFPRSHADCPLGRVVVAGETSLTDPDRLSGWIAIESSNPPADAVKWREDAEKLLEHCRRILSLASSTMLQAPVLEFVHGDRYEVEVLSQSRQHSPVMRVFHKLNLQPALDAAIASYFNPPLEARNLFFAIEWFTMDSTYNEVRLVNAMTALENLIDSNLTPEEALIEPKPAFEKTRRALRKVIRICLERWSPERAEAAREELGEKLLDLNRRPLKRKLYLLAERWRVPFDGISETQVTRAIRARNAIVHSGHHPSLSEGPDLWDHMTLVRELVVRFLLTAIGYRGDYLSHFGGYRHAHFPPGAEGNSSSSEKKDN